MDGVEGPAAGMWQVAVVVGALGFWAGWFAPAIVRWVDRWLWVTEREPWLWRDR